MDVIEFQESEVMFSDDYSSDQSEESNDSKNVAWTSKHNNNIQSEGSKMGCKRRKTLKKTKKVSSPLPIYIPGSGNQYPFRYDSDEASSRPFNADFDDDDHDDDEMVGLPPHLIIERRRASEDLARSFPLKERNMYYVRNYIIIMNDELL